MYWQEWLEEHGFDVQVAQRMTVQTFVGAALLAQKQQHLTLQELENRVASKKGVTEAGLESMRELEIERALRYSFEKSALKIQQFSK